MALTFLPKGAAQATQPPFIATPTVECAAPTVTPTPIKPKKGQAKRLPLDGVRLDLPMRLRTGHMLALFGVSGAQFYKLRKAGKIPEPAGHIGTGKRPAPYWVTTQIAPFI